MRVYAVLDLKAGQVVHAVAGQRDRYRPVSSELVRSAEPHDVARAFAERFGIFDTYVADLDAIAGQSPDFKSLHAISATGMRLLLDAGVSRVQQAQSLLDELSGQLHGLVVPLETATSASEWPALVELLGLGRAVFGLDLAAGRPLTKVSPWARQSPLEIAQQAWAAGFRRLIALDLHRVGSGQGPSTLQLCRQLGQQHDWTELISGGGVRGQADLQALADAGCHAALVASALHARPGEWERR